ncbi:MAG: hypothetical protein FJW96_13190 [Actinobacteria bacterium]|nr:hypothetical protein [Actinomycetota bacterium]
MTLRLNPFDDYPFHQAIAPIDIPVTSDPHFNDGYWWSFYAPGYYGFCGLRVHPNSNVMDGYAGLVVGGEQRNVRFSRALRPRANDLAVGPFRLTIEEPMVRQRLQLGPNETGVEFDVVAEASGSMTLEEPHVQYRHGVVLNHLLRYSGATRTTGTVSVDGDSFAIDRWYGARDHSWGIRSTMGPHIPIRGTEQRMSSDPRAIRIWVPFECGDESGFFHTHEDAQGNALDFQGVIHRGDETIELASVRHAFEYEDGRRLTGGTYTLVDVGGAERAYRFRVVCPPAHPQGFGYTRGWSDGGNPGVWRGELVIESNRFDVSDPLARSGADHLPRERWLGGTEFACSLEGPDGAVGMAHVEHMIYGSYAPYGFEGKWLPD